MHSTHTDESHSCRERLLRESSDLPPALEPAYNYEYIPSLTLFEIMTRERANPTDCATYVSTK